MNKILTFGDGYAANHIWPEWPAVLQALYPELEHENFGAVGAGDEFIATAVVQAHQRWPQAFFIVQWAQSNRFDKLIQDTSWDSIIDSDPVYDFNRVNLHGQTWWLSSASQQPAVRQYHDQYVQTKQADLRSSNYRYLVANLLQERSIFFDLAKIRNFANQPRFATVRQQHVQPSPIVHMTWVEEYLVPKLPWPVDLSRLKQLKNRINQQNWQAFDPDREQIWNDICKF
jgi:hypothetical protein